MKKAYNHEPWEGLCVVLNSFGNCVSCFFDMLSDCDYEGASFDGTRRDEIFRLSGTCGDVVYIAFDNYKKTST
jgi:hypothetical protein